MSALPVGAHASAPLRYIAWINMDKREDYWAYTEKKLIEHMHWRNMDPGSPQWIYLSTILNYKMSENNSRNTKRLIWATWGLVLVTAILTLVTFLK